jgi:hypothetical protein
MIYGYSAENHDWDLTLNSAAELCKIGNLMDRTPSTGNLSKGFSCFTGSMLLSFCAIESFTSSVAISMPKESCFKNFDYAAYRKARTFWDKVERVCAAAAIPVDRSNGLFHTIEEMRVWRNLVTHSAPYMIEETEIENTTTAPLEIHKPLLHQQYPRLAKSETAVKFYHAAYDYLDLIKSKTGLEPRASVTYKILEAKEV